MFQFTRHSFFAATFAFAGIAHAQVVIRLGVTAGPRAQIAEVAKKVAQRHGLKLQIVEFQDDIQPNAAPDSGDLQANSYRHLPSLQTQIQSRGYKISAVGETVAFPMGFHSKKYKTLAELPEGAKVGIQNDPSNSGRAFALLQKYGVIKLEPGAGTSAAPFDVTENSKKLQIARIEAAQPPRSLDDLAASAINANCAVQANLVSTRDAIAIEDAKSPCANLLAVRPQDKDKPWVAKLAEAFQSPEIEKLVESSFDGSLVVAF